MHDRVDRLTMSGLTIGEDWRPFVAPIGPSLESATSFARGYALTKLRLDLVSSLQFSAWLSKHWWWQRVGIAHSSHDCPIARYLKSKGFADVSVDLSKIHVSLENVSYGGEKISVRVVMNVPRWGREFMAEIDGKPPIRGSISAWRARKVLLAVRRARGAVQ